MYSRIVSGAVLGVEGFGIGVEADVSSGLPVFDMVGALSSEVKEARERVRTALKNSGYPLPAKRITVNLSPAYVHKEGASFDLPIAVAILTAIGYISQEQAEQYMIVGELGLNGEIRSVNGVLPLLSYAQKQGILKAIVPADNACEGTAIKGMNVYGVQSLAQVVEFFQTQMLKPLDTSVTVIENSLPEYEHDFAEVVGQGYVKRALEIAAAGFHNAMMIGPPGSGKSMLAKCLPSILPPLSLEERIDLSKIYSVKGLLKETGTLLSKRPFRAPHHTISPTALTGGGKNPLPGEMSLAHKGVLFLDELPEFRRETLEVMRQPLEDKKVIVARVAAVCAFPSDFMLIAAMNPCPCGQYPDMNKCRCTPGQMKRYLGKISQPLLDRIDLGVETPRIPYDELRKSKKEETSKEIRNRVVAAQQIQKKRYEKDGIKFNSQLTPKLISKYCRLGKIQEKTLQNAMQFYELSARAYHRILKVARTIADLEGCEQIKEEHLTEAILYHNGNRKYFEKQ